MIYKSPQVSRRMNTKQKGYIYFRKPLGKGYPSLKDFPKRLFPALSLLSCFSKSTKSKHLQPCLLNGLGIVRRHIISGPWDLDDLDEPSLEGRAPESSGKQKCLSRAIISSPFKSSALDAGPQTRPSIQLD